MHKGCLPILIVAFIVLAGIGAGFTAFAADPKAPDEAMKITPIKSGGSRVDIPAGKLNDDVWPQLEKLGDVKILSVKGHEFNNAAVDRVVKLSTIESIVIYNPGFDDKGLAALAALPNLRTINIDHGLTLNGSGLATFAGKKLESFNIGGSKVDDAGMEGIGKVSQLTELTIRHVHMTGAGFANFRKIGGLKKATFFAGFHPEVRGSDLAALSGLKELTDLTLAEMVLTYDEGLIHLKPLHQLKRLTLKACAISDADLAKLKSDLPETKIEFTPATAENLKFYENALAKAKAGVTEKK